MEFQKPDKRAINWWQTKRFLTLIMIVAVVLAIRAILTATGVLDGRAAKIGMWVIVALYFVTIPLMPRIEYKQWGYKILEDQVVIRHGIFWRSETVIPIIRIQNITKDQGPVARMFDLFDVEISIASGAFDICGVTEETADAISQNLKNRLYARIEESEGDSQKAAADLKNDTPATGEDSQDNGEQ